jgi:hypothetical protein
MSAVATREPRMEPMRRGSAEPRPGRLFEPSGPTLEDAILATWEELVDAGRASCPVCAAEMSPATGCEACGSQLS